MEAARRSFDLRREHQQGRPFVPSSNVGREFLAAGVPISALYDPDPPRMDHVIFLGGNRFEFLRHCDKLRADVLGDDGLVAYEVVTFLAYDGPSDNQFGFADDGFRNAVDIIAWCLSTDEVASWTGRAVVLGEECLAWVRHGVGATIIYRSPLTWMLNGRDGVVIIDQTPGRAARALLDCDPIRPEDEAHGYELMPLLTISPAIIAHRPGA